MVPNIIEVSKFIFEQGYTRTDMESTIFHECIHYKDYLLNGEIQPRDKAGWIENMYTLKYTKEDIDLLIYNIEQEAFKRGLPLDQNSRDSEEWKLLLFEFNYNTIVSMYENGITYESFYNKEYIRREVNAYSSQYNYYKNSMSSNVAKFIYLKSQTLQKLYEQLK